ncbi:hypothetical protein C8A05DRAFT_18530 [Staphylotrichum tortipilum]|uniref:RING-type domain-containing protein n=1 Tax=Staphylotrichum tortipilum TaxID=2831512 RepID=A0AAN6MF45_9PEZI|nr:hypothetical protein C8A05DRAFT_18530 [Staphylotrichum longicolle]
MAAVAGLGSDPAAEPHDEPDPGWEALVLTCFPDICPDFLAKLGDEHGRDPHRITTHLLDELEKDRPYPRRPPIAKRKRDEADDGGEDAERRRKLERRDPEFANENRDYVRVYTKTAKALLKASFPSRYSEDVDGILKQNFNGLYTSYLTLDKADWCAKEAPARTKKISARGPHPEQALRDSNVKAEQDALAVFEAAREKCRAEAEAREEEHRKEQEEAENRKFAESTGTMGECGCCYDDVPLNRMAHCDAAGDAVHWFCYTCLRRTTEAAIGNSQYHLECPSTDGCDATFAKDQRALFLDDSLVKALELIEQDAVLRMAGIENLATCPFCPYAAEYPPVEENKEFRCENPECGRVSCRLCREETHIPKTCDEVAKENTLSVRRTVEEAMSAALIRKCNKCSTPFIKENGCNKMTCVRPGCGNVQCYVCSKSCDYSHFDDAGRGGKKGNCPLFDSVEDRHERDVQAAEEEILKRLAEEKPGLEAAMLKVNFSDKVKKDDERRKLANPGPQNIVRYPFPGQPVVIDPNNRHALGGHGLVFLANNHPALGGQAPVVQADNRHGLGGQAAVVQADNRHAPGGQVGVVQADNHHGLGPVAGHQMLPDDFGML